MPPSPKGATKRQPVPRGIARNGPVIFSYGFRPFFLAAGLWAIAAMGVSPAAARAIAHPINFIVTPIGSVARKGPPVPAGPKLAAL